MDRRINEKTKPADWSSMRGIKFIQKSKSKYNWFAEQGLYDMLVMRFKLLITTKQFSLTRALKSFTTFHSTSTFLPAYTFDKAVQFSILTDLCDEESVTNQQRIY